MKENKKKRIMNPLIKRVPKELLGEWRKYLVIFLLLSMTIGFVSGMYVANHSMLISIANANRDNKLEDGHFELEDEASDELIKAIESGEKIDLRAYFIDEAHKEIDDKIEEEAPKRSLCVSKYLVKTIRRGKKCQAADIIICSDYFKCVLIIRISGF